MDLNSIHYLYPATLYASQKPIFIHTILGSCVAICLYDPVLKFGGMNHFMLPLWNGNGLASPKYGNIAIDKLIEKLILFGSAKYNLKAKVFGGSDILSQTINMFNIGERNIQIARKLMEDNDIQVVSSNVGGSRGRKIRFNTFTGEVTMTWINKSEALKEDVIKQPVSFFKIP